MGSKGKPAQIPTPTFFVRVYHKDGFEILNLTNSTKEKAIAASKKIWINAEWGKQKPYRVTIINELMQTIVDYDERKLNKTTK